MCVLIYISLYIFLQTCPDGFWNLISANYTSELKSNCLKTAKVRRRNAKIWRGEASWKENEWARDRLIVERREWENERMRELGKQDMPDTKNDRLPSSSFCRLINVSCRFCKPSCMPDIELTKPKHSDKPCKTSTTLARSLQCNAIIKQVLR